VAPVGFVWHQNGNQISTEQDPLVYTGTSSFWLRVTATDNTGQVAVDSMFVTVSSSSPSNCTY
jgi:hypothetical protein